MMYAINQPRPGGSNPNSRVFNLSYVVTVVVATMLTFSFADVATAQRSYASASAMTALPDVMSSDELNAPLRQAFDEARETGTAIDEATWKRFSKRLVDALTGDHYRLKADAMRLVIQYEGYVDVDEARFELVRAYRDHANDNMRRLAAVAIVASGNDWATNFLKRSIDYERSEAVRFTIVSLLADKGIVRLRPVGPAVQIGSRESTPAEPGS